MGRPIHLPLPLPGHAAPAGGFEVPLEMLSACRHRIERQCATLRRLVAHLATQGADADARAAAQAVLRYFDTAAPDHHADEEADLFPALIESMAGSDARCIRDLTNALTRDHRAIDAAWRPLHAALQSVAAGDPEPLTAAQVDPFIALQERHLALEERELLPMAQRLLGDDALQQIGQAMRQRRGIPAPD